MTPLALVNVYWNFQYGHCFSQITDQKRPEFQLFSISLRRCSLWTKLRHGKKKKKTNMEKNSRRKGERRKLIVSNTIKISFWPKILLIYTK